MKRTTMAGAGAVLLSALLLVGACAPRQHASTNAVAAEAGRDGVTLFLASYLKAFNDRNMHALAAHYAEDARVHLSGGESGYVLNRTQLAAALEMKRSAWENNAVRLEHYTVTDLNESDGVLRASVRFDVRSRKWNGSYPVVFALREKGGALLITEENGS